MTHSRQVMTSARSNEHYTPAAVLAPVYEILGTVELDPCSNSKTNPNVKCNRCFVRDDDGLTQDWNAKTVFVNPPFSSSAAWAAKAIAEHQTNQTEIIFLCKAAVDTRWGQRLLDYPHCHWRGRIKFEGNGGKLAPFACTIFYLGDHWQKFQQVFNSYGVVQPGRILFEQMVVPKKGTTRKLTNPRGKGKKPASGTIKKVSARKDKAGRTTCDRYLYTFRLDGKSKSKHVPKTKVVAVEQAIANNKSVNWILENIL